MCVQDLIEFPPISDLDGGCDSHSSAYTEQGRILVGESRKRTRIEKQGCTNIRRGGGGDVQ
jgi:hypothetical protein